MVALAAHEACSLWAITFQVSESLLQAKEIELLLMSIATDGLAFIGRCLRMRSKCNGGARFVSHCG